MNDTNQTNSSSTKEAWCSNLKFPCGDFAKMSQMMKNFCGGEEGGFNCKAMMQKMCCGTSGESNGN